MSHTNHEEDRLRALLRAAVPETPGIDPAPATRARSRRGPAVAVLAAAAAVVAVAVVPLVLDGPDGRPSPGADGSTAATSTPPAPTRSVNPYRGGCPTELPPVRRAERDLPDLDEVRAVRLCADPDGPADDPMDALVESGVDEMAEGVRTLGAPEEARCAAFSYLPLTTSLAFTLDDGSLVVVPTDLCTDLRRDGDGDRVDASAVTAAFLAALDTQRQTSSYPLVDIDLPDVGCDTRTTQAPVRPTDSVFDGPVLCNGPAARPVEVTAAGERALEAALARTPEPSETGTSGGYDDEMPYLLYRTGRYDVVRLSPTSGGLLMDPWQVGFGLGRSTLVPLDLAAVIDP